MDKSEKYYKALEYLDVEPDGSVWRKERETAMPTGGVRHQPRQKAKIRKSKTGYLQVPVGFGSKIYHLFVHRLVATAFIPKPEGWDETWQVNHKNGIKTDCSVSNLEWCTQSDNQKHAFRTGLNKPHDGGTSKPVEQIDLKTGEVVEKYESISDAANKNNFRISRISACCLGYYGCRSYKGYGWRFAL